MSDINVVVIGGRLGQEPEIRYSSGGTAIASLSVAVNNYDKREDDNQKTNWVRVVVFGKTAEFLGEKAGVGARVTVKGMLDENRWEDKQGNKRSILQVVVGVGGEVKLHDFKDTDNSWGASAGSNKTQPPRQQASQQTSQQPDFDDDIPF
jgi:single-strand DNA-binding protein